VTARRTESELVEVGALEDLTVGRFSLVNVDGKEVGLVRTADDRVFAVLNHCPHRGAPVCLGRVSGTMLPAPPGVLEYGLESSVLTCPWHGWEFELETGRALWGISRSRLRTYAVEIRDGRVLISVKRSREEDLS
jgi:nitrite reductase (NADH) small subunit